MASGGAGQSSSPAERRSSGHRSWRAASRADGPRHQWQQISEQPSKRRGMSRSSHRIRVGLFFLGSAALAGLLIWHLLFAPAQTPFLAVSLTAYEWPLPPNSWAAEDLAGLSDLDRKTLELVDLSPDWRSTERGLVKFDEALQKAKHAARRAGTIILYLSMHGSVDGQGRACLIPPDAGAQDSTSWLPLATLLEHVHKASFPSSVHKLLILDCSKQPVNWNIGAIGGAFVAAAPQAVEEAKLPNLSVLCATSDCESAMASPALRSSAFGHYLRLGLAGAADDGDSGGNHDGRISLHELKDYVAAHVHGWVLHHAGVPQTPSVFGSKKNFQIGWALRSSTWRDMEARSRRTEMATASVPADRTAPLWRKVDALRSARPWRFDPVGWRNIEHRLLWLEQLSVAGKAYEERATAVATQLTNDLTAAETRLSAAMKTRSLPAYSGVLAGAEVISPVKPHSLPLAELWGLADRDVVLGLKQQWQRCQETATANNLAAAIAAFDSANMPVMDEANFLAIWRRAFVPQQWANASVLSQTLRAHELAEQQAVPAASDDGPGDERAHAWVRADLAAVDRQRRTLEDAVLVGPAKTASSADGSELVNTLTSEKLGQRSAKAFATRDELWAKVPYLAQWLCRPQYDVDHEKAADASIRQTLIPLIEAGMELEQRLKRKDGQDGEGLTWSADSAVDLVERKMAEAEAILRTAVDAALADGEQAIGTHEIDALLSLPTLRWETRQRLTHERLEFYLRQAAQYDGPFDGAGKLVSGATSVGPYSGRVTRWGKHPLVMLVDPQLVAKSPNEAAAEEAIKTCGALGAEIRQRLAALVANEVRSLPAGGARGSANSKAGGSVGTLCPAESLVRAAAAIWFPRPSVDSVRELRRADLQDFFIWRAERALEDLYGGAASGREPFFAVSASDYLAAARGLGPLSEDAAKRLEQDEDLLSRRRIAVREALSVNAADVLLVDQATSIHSELAVKVRTPEAATALPTASAAVYLADEIGRIDHTSSGIDVPVLGKRAGDALVDEQLTLESAGLTERGPVLGAIASIRGNEITAPVLLRAPGGVQVEYKQPVYGPPRVTVLGHERKQASVVFILDCSHSMQEQAATESPDGTGGDRSTRMELAKRALNMLLADLADRGTLRVGVRAFGHRVGWSTTENGKLLRQTGYGEEIPAELRPYADVELILPLGRFDSIAAGRVFDKLQTVKAWGESPIYLALQQAVADFRTDENPARSIVLITDGQNYQFNPPREFQPQLSEVLASAERNKIAIHVVGFGMNEAESRSAAAEFTQIASRTGGTYVPAANATGLLDSLQRLLAPGEFRVADANGAVLAEAELGQVVTVMAHRGRRRYQVAFEQLREAVELAGGEAVELALRRGEQRMEVVPYLKGSPRFEPLIAQDDASATRLTAGVHRSIRTPDGVQFPISIQPADGHFVPRPVEMWVEVLPLGLPAEVSNGPYIFYDTPLIAGTSVPVANLLAKKWPADATKAEVRIWTKDSPSTPSEERSLVEVADRLPEEGGGFPIAGNPGIRYQVRTTGGNGETLIVGLVERHERADTVGSVKVTLSPPPARASHQFDPRNRVAVHTFELDAAAADRGRVLVQFTKRENAQAHALRTVQPVVADVSDRSDVLELTPAISGR